MEFFYNFVFSSLKPDSRYAIALAACLLWFLTGCHNPPLPDTKIDQYSYGVTVKARDGQLHINLDNPLHCPLRVWITAKEASLQKRLDTLNPFVIPPLQDTILYVAFEMQADPRLNLSSRLGDPSAPFQKTPLSLPFQKGSTYSIIQGHNSQPTHNTDWSRYAIDFDLGRKDTVCAADDGFVVGVVDAYQHGGSDPKWKPFGNFITLYHPISGLYTQYVHLEHHGSLVRLGDTVLRGMPIGLAGMTGQTNIQHLHFNALIPDTSIAGLRSVPVDFSEGYKGPFMDRGIRVKK